MLAVYGGTGYADQTRALGRGVDVVIATPGRALDLVRTDGASDVAAVLKQQPEGGYNVSLRSKGATDVGRLATGFGGGGHKYAAGYTTDLDAEAAVAALVAELATTPASAPVG